MRARRLLATAWRSLFRGAVAAVSGVLLVSCTFAPLPSGPEPGSDPTTTATVDASAPGRTPSRGPPSLEWWVRPDQLGAQSAAGAFAVKFVEIANLDLHVYCGMRSPT